MLKNESSESNEFFDQIRELLNMFTERGEGKVDINLKCHPRRNGYRELKVYAPNLFPSLNCISIINLKDYLTCLHNSAEEEAFSIFQQSLLDILDQGGFGQVQLKFDKNKREETIIFCEVTISQRHVVSSI